eukprot:1152052-Pelagomonas_calceolata.AAC.7
MHTVERSPSNCDCHETRHEKQEFSCLACPAVALQVHAHNGAFTLRLRQGTRTVLLNQVLACQWPSVKTFY